MRQRLWLAVFLQLAGLKGKRVKIRFVPKSPSWDPKPWHPWEELESLEEENLVKWKKTPPLRPDLKHNGKIYNSACSQRPEERPDVRNDYVSQEILSTWTLCIWKALKGAMKTIHPVGHEAVEYGVEVINLNAIEVEQTQDSKSLCFTKSELYGLSQCETMCRRFLIWPNRRHMVIPAWVPRNNRNWRTIEKEWPLLRRRIKRKSRHSRSFLCQARVG